MTKKRKKVAIFTQKQTEEQLCINKLTEQIGTAYANRFI